MFQSIRKELRETAKVMAPLLLSIPVIALAAGILLRVALQGTLWYRVALAFEDLFLLSVFAAFPVAFFQMVVRFYGKLVRQNTLPGQPAGVAGLILPGMIVSFLWYIGAALAGLAGCALIDKISRYYDYICYIDGFLHIFSPVNTLLICAEALICAFLFHASVTLHFCGAMALGHRFKRCRILLSVVFYILMSVAVSLVFALLLLLVTGKCSAEPFSVWLDNRLGDAYAPYLHLLPHKLFVIGASCLVLRTGLFLGVTALGLKQRCPAEKG